MDVIDDLEEFEEVEQDLESYKDRMPGSLSAVSLTTVEQDNLLDYLDKAYPQSASELLYAMLGDRYLMYFDVLEGLTIRIPNRKTLTKIINYVRIYTYVKSRGCTDDAYEAASRLYKKRVSSIHRIVERVESKINIEEESNG